MSKSRRAPLGALPFNTSEPDGVMDLALRLVTAIKEEEALESRRTAAFEAANVSGRAYLDDACLHALDRIEALRDLIASTKAKTLADAVVHIHEAVTRIDRVDTCTGPHHEDIRAIKRLLHSAADVVANAASATEPRVADLLTSDFVYPRNLDPWIAVEDRCEALREVPV